LHIGEIAAKRRGKGSVERIEYYSTMLGPEEDSVGHWLSYSHRVPGWLTDSEARQLYLLARNITTARMPTAVERGSWLGKSSIMIAGGLAGRPGARLYCVDPFGKDENPEYQRLYYDALLANMDESLEQAFSHHIHQSGLSTGAQAVRGYSFEIVRTWTAPIDLLFIDANHEYDAVHRDFKQWAPFVRVGGVVALHDASPAWPGPLRVRDESMQHPIFDTFSQVDSLAWAVKLR
jgi:predicted O-methyltransferase YrrM